LHFRAANGPTCDDLIHFEVYICVGNVVIADIGDSAQSLVAADGHRQRERCREGGCRATR
jgi:hypothetical protein